jgi:asparagine synthase (glutamine-hydrolysing)
MRLKNAFNRLQFSDAQNITACFDLYPGVVKQDISRFIGSEANDGYVTKLSSEACKHPNSFLSALLYFQLKTYLCALLMKQDKMSMAAGIETRVPFLDHSLVEFAFSLPDKMKIKGKEGKYILKRFAAGRIPHKIAYRRKAGFPVPLNRWFQQKGNAFIDALLSKETKDDSFLNYDFLLRTVKGYQRGEPNLDMKIWMLLNLELWRRIYLK